MRRSLRALSRDEEGAALAEFAIVAPVMLLLLVGVAEVVQALEVQRRVENVASSIADVTSRERIVDTQTLNDILRAGQGLMTPLPSAELGERIASFTADSAGRAKLDWSADGPTPYNGSAKLDPAALQLKPNESVIVADVSYPYHPMAKLVLPDDIGLQKRMILTPRVAAQVQKTK